MKRTGHSTSVSESEGKIATNEKNGKGGGLVVIGAGHGRTGTLSMKEALEILGLGPCYHMREVAMNKGHADLWYRMYKTPRGDSNRPDWTEIFSNYHSTMDFPGFIFYRELMDVYPAAKVILTLRDPEKWYESVHVTIGRLYQGGLSTLGLRFFSNMIPRMRSLGRMRLALMEEGFNRGDSSKEGWIRSYKRHNEEVQQVVPQERLLVYQVGEGWEPLCKFLGLPVPDVPFPHVNDSSSFQRRVMIGNLIGFFVLFIFLMLAVLLIYLLWHYVF